MNRKKRSGFVITTCIVGTSPLQDAPVLYRIVLLTAIQQDTEPWKSQRLAVQVVGTLPGKFLQLIFADDLHPERLCLLVLGTGGLAQNKIAGLFAHVIRDLAAM